MIINEEVLVKINNTNIEHYKLKYDVKYGDKLLALSTCYSTADNSRFVVAARRLRDGETT